MASQGVVTLRSLRSLGPDQLTELAHLHAQEVASLLSRMGPAAVRRFYDVVWADAEAICIVAVQSEAVLGGIVGSPDPMRLFDGLRRPLWWFVWEVALRRPTVLVQVIRSRVAAAPTAGPQPGVIESLYLVVAREARGRGLGRTLLDAFAAEARAAGRTKVRGSVEFANRKALDLYLKNGWDHR